MEAIKGTGIALIAALAIVVPFSIKQDRPLGWLFSLYGNTLGSYAYATLNTANLYYLFGANWTSLAQGAPKLMLGLSVVVFAGFTFWAFAASKRRKKVCAFVSDKKRFAFLFAAMAAYMLILFLANANYNWFGYGMMVFVYLFSILCMERDKRNDTLVYYMTLALIGVYVLGVKVHERYLFPALLLLLVSYVHSKDSRILVLYAGFSATTFINTAIVLENSILFGAEHGHLNEDTLIINFLLCIVNLSLCVVAGWVAFTGIRESKKIHEKRPDKQKDNQPNETGLGYQQMLLNPHDHRLHLKIWDYVVLLVVTVSYAVLAFTNLGSTVAPQTAWVSTSEDESVILELEQPSTFSVLYYAGVSYNDFAIAVSEDGENWSEAYPCQMREGLCYRWNYAVKAQSSGKDITYSASRPENILWLSGKYLKVDACEAGLNLWEIVVRDEEGNNVPLKMISNPNSRPELLNTSKPAANLVDEMDTCIGEPGWYNGTYFDEIYHARTAYEHLHGQAPYETTHPPLGKLLMSAAIAVFGMTPFGWRFAGTLIGVLMLPVIYLLALQLTHKRSVAFVSLFALTFDLMHFTQTRIATIDSFPVFFIMLTYLFMVRYMQMDSFAVSDPARQRLMDQNYLKTLIPLFLCGICMGLSIASKWIGIYSAVGLAALFFLTMYRHLRVNDVAWKTDENAFDSKTNARIHAARAFTVHRIAITCGFCVLSFVIIPCAIYALCYIPYLSPTGPVTLKRIIQAQENMFNYHSQPGLGADHPFQSPWWQWPFILKPMWYSQDTFEPSGYASTIICMGNPWVFYIGAVAMILLLACWVLKYFHVESNKISLRPGDGDLTFAYVSIGFLVQYLPWVLVPRSMYIYHYFASVPFIILATAILLERFLCNKPRLRTAAILVYIVGAALFFIMFFPYASGRLTDVAWLDAMKWFPRLYY